MDELSEQRFRGIESVEMVTALLQRVRNSHPTAGTYQAAEIQFWWARERRTDDIDQLFWFDADGLPEAAAVITDFSDSPSLVYGEPILALHLMPNASAELTKHVVDSALSHAAALGTEALELEIEQRDSQLIDLMTSRGFTKQGAAVVECWLDAKDRPEISQLHDGYRLVSRTDIMSKQPHHMARPNRTNVEDRLRQTSIYRSDLDLVVLDPNDEPAAFAMFWHDATTQTGVIEPLGTHEEHRKLGLARHILTVGIDRLAEAGATRISVGYEPDNPASGHLYRSVGFEPSQHTDVYAGPTTA